MNTLSGAGDARKPNQKVVLSAAALQLAAKRDAWGRNAMMPEPELGDNNASSRHHSCSNAAAALYFEHTPKSS